MSRTVKVIWPYSEDFDFASRWPPIRDVLFQHGFDSRAVTSSSFVMLDCSEASVSELESKIPKIDPDFSVT